MPPKAQAPAITMVATKNTPGTSNKRKAPGPLNPQQKQKIARTKGPRFAIRRDPATQEISFVGRPDWSQEASDISVNQDPLVGDVEDRRHLLHWDEQLKPILGSVFTAMQREFPATLLSELQAPLKARQYVTRAKTADDYMLYVAKRINGAPDNLVPDRADINKAIEIVRENVRNYFNRLTTDSGYRADVSAYPQVDPAQPQAIARMGQYKTLARQYLDSNDTSTPIKTKISEIQAQLLQHIDSCHAPHQLWTFLQELQYSVTFDLSAKATRDKTSKSLVWQRKMAANQERPARERYQDLLSFLD